MNNIKYVGMDVHRSITVIVVLNELGQVESRSQIKTKGGNICDFFRGISGKVEVVFEEGAHSAWLYKLLKPLVASVTVCDPRHNKLIEDGNKSDDEDAETLAHLLRLGAVKAVYKGDDQQQQLKEICRAYDNLIEDSTRVQNRLKAIYRGRGISCSGHALYRADQRSDWLAKLGEDDRRGIQILIENLDKDWSLAGLTKLVYGAPKLLRGLPLDAPPDEELKRSQRSFFVALYSLLCGSDTGPRLPTLFLSIGKERARKLLTPLDGCL